MKRDFAREACAQIRDSQPRHQKIGKLVALGRQRLGRLGMFRFGEQFRVKDMQHGSAGTGGNHHRFSSFQFLQDRQSNGPRLFPEARVEGWLAAASDILVVLYFVPKPFEDVDHADPHLREQQVDETRHKQSDSHFSEGGGFRPELWGFRLKAGHRT